MCGIMGYFAFGKQLPQKEKITNMFSLLESRGRDASGYAFIKDGALIVNKSAIRSSLMIKTEEWEKLELPKMMILHTRMKTQGSELNNANNHPLFSKQGLCIVHNGMVLNDREIFGKNQRDAEVDSESILYLLSQKQKGDKIKRLFDRIEGSFAVAVINKEHPDELLLIKKDNPIDLYYNEEEDILYFCSEKSIMQESLGLKQITKRGFNLGELPYHYYEMGNNYSLQINCEGVKKYTKHYPNVNRNRWYYQRPQQSGDEIMIECPYCMEYTSYHMEKLFNRCHNCGSPINEEEIYV